MNEVLFDKEDYTNSMSRLQSRNILSDVVAFVDVRTKSDNRSRAIGGQLELLGATVTEKFEKNVTHVIFKDGTKATHDKAVKKGIIMVSVLWVESCKEQGRRVDERDFVVSLPECYSTPSFVSRFRKFKSMQPRSFEEDLASSTEKAKRRNKRLKSHGSTVGNKITPVLAPESAPRILMPRQGSPLNASIPDTPSSMMRRIERLQLGKTLDSSPDISAVASPLINDTSEPLQRKLFAYVDDVGTLADSSLTSVSSNENLLTKPKRRLLPATDSLKAPHLISPAHTDQNTRLPKLIDTPRATKGKKRTRNSLDKDQSANTVSMDPDGRSESSDKRRKTCETTMLASYVEHMAKQPTSCTSDKTLVEGKTRRRSGRPTLKALAEKFSNALDELKVHSAPPILEDRGEMSTTRRGASRMQGRPSMFEFKTSKPRLIVDKIDELMKDFDSSPNDADDVGETSGDKTMDLSESFGDTLNCRKVQVVKPIVQATKKRQSLVMTSLHTQEQEIAIAAVKSLGGFTITDSVGEATTHVVCGEQRRTINLLAAVAKGCWVLSKEWVMRSVENCAWLDEAEFEMCRTYPGAKASRLNSSNKTARGIFSHIGCIHVARECKPTKEQLESLLAWSGCEVTTCIRKAKINIVTEAANCHPDIVNVSSNWVLDCIMAQEPLPVDQYTLYTLKRAGSPEY